MVGWIRNVQKGRHCSTWFQICANYSCEREPLGNGFQCDSKVQIYDSGLPSDVPVSTQAAICSIMRPQSTMLNFDVVNVQAQSNSYDCGLFTIAYAAELVHGNDPAVSHVNVASLRRHLEERISRNHLDPFQILKETFGQKIKLTLKAEIYSPRPRNVAGPQGMRNPTKGHVIINSMQRASTWPAYLFISQTIWCLAHRIPFLCYEFIFPISHST